MKLGCNEYKERNVVPYDTWPIQTKEKKSNIFCLLSLADSNQSDTKMYAGTPALGLVSTEPIPGQCRELAVAEKWTSCYYPPVQKLSVHADKGQSVFCKPCLSEILKHPAENTEVFKYKSNILYTYVLLSCGPNTKYIIWYVFIKIVFPFYSHGKRRRANRPVSSNICTLCCIKNDMDGDFCLGDPAWREAHCGRQGINLGLMQWNRLHGIKQSKNNKAISHWISLWWCVCKCVYMYVYVCVCVCVYVCVCVCIFICICIWYMRIYHWTRAWIIEWKHIEIYVVNKAFLTWLLIG